MKIAFDSTNPRPILVEYIRLKAKCIWCTMHTAEGMILCANSRSHDDNKPTLLMEHNFVGMR